MPHDGLLQGDRAHRDCRRFRLCAVVCTLVVAAAATTAGAQADGSLRADACTPPLPAYALPGASPGLGRVTHGLVVVPSVTGRDLAVAVATLARAHLALALPYGVAPQRVGIALGDAAATTQTPSAGTHVRPGTVVRLTTMNLSLPGSIAIPATPHPATIAGAAPLPPTAAKVGLDAYVVAHQSPAPGTVVPWGGASDATAPGGYRQTIVSVSLAARAG